MPRQEALAGYRAVRSNGLKFIHQYVIYTLVGSYLGEIASAMEYG